MAMASASFRSFFLTTYKCFHMLWRHQPNLVAKRAGCARPEMGSGTRFHYDATCRCLSQQRMQLAATHLLAQRCLAAEIHAMKLDTCLARSIARVVVLFICPILQWYGKC